MGKLYLIQPWQDRRSRSLPEWTGDGGLEAAFTSREAAARHLDEKEAEARHAGNIWPIYQHMNSLDDLLEWTDFDEPVFLDYLLDADIPVPPEERWGEEGDLWQGWLEGLGREKLARLYEGLHRFHFHEMIEVDWVEGDYAPEQWEDWEKDPGQRWRDQRAQDMARWQDLRARGGDIPF